MTARFLLRLGERAIVLVPGVKMVVGRAEQCAISIDDPQVSRAHAAFLARAGRVTVRDLGSRNGVVVNGSKIPGSVEIRPGDVTMIGKHELRLEEIDQGATTTVPGVDRQIARTRPMPHARDIQTAALSLFQAFLEACQDSLASGRIEDAKKSVEYLCSTIEDAQRRQLPVDPSVIRGATKYLLALATEMLDGMWVERALSLQRASNVLLDDVATDAIVALLPRLRPVPAFAVRSYVAATRRAAHTPQDAERLRRLEKAVSAVASERA